MLNISLSKNKLFSFTIIHLFVILSGMAALSWEVIWQIKSGLALGVSAWGTAVTLSTTMGGMSLGALITGRILNNTELKNPLKAYGLLEILIGLYGLTLGLSFGMVENLDTYIYSHNPTFATPFHILGIVGVLLIPTFAMGATIPVLGLISKKYHIALSGLYGLNTFGAATGIMLAAFLWIPLLGISNAIWIFALINLVVGAAAYKINYEPKKGEVKKKKENLSILLKETYNFKTALLIAFVTGFSTFMLEVSWFRSMTASFYSTTAAFAIMLACVLTALSLGAAFAPLLKRKEINLGAILCWSGIAILLITPIVERMDLFMYSAAKYPFLLLTRWFFLSLYIIGPAIIMLGVALPWLLNEQKDTKKWGILYGTNAFAAILGSVTAAWLLLPSIGFAKTSWATGLILALLGFYILRSYSKKKTLIIALICSLFVAITFESGVGRKRVQGQSYLTDSFGGPNETLNVYKVYEGPDSTISVIGFDESRRILMIDGFLTTLQTGDELVEHYMPWMGYLPMIAHPNPENALVICFGTGQTANAVRNAGPKSLDIVDLNKNVLKLASYFPANEGVLEDDRVSTTVMDGRAYIRRTEKKYDVITLEPMPPQFAGVNALYSKEFYEHAKSKMNENGIIAQWLPFHIVPAILSASVSKTFHEVFPNSILWVDTSSTGILLGSANENLDLEKLWPGYKKNPKLYDLSLKEVRNGVLLNKESMKEYVKHGIVITDNNQELSYGKSVYAIHGSKGTYTIDNFELINEAQPFNWSELWDEDTPRADYMLTPPEEN
jgi:spermidine synthase